MSFGPLQFRANLNAEGLKARWALLYLSPVAAIILLAIAGAGGAFTKGPGGVPASLGLMALGIVLIFYVGLPLLTLNWYAKYFRHAAEATSLGDLEFSFDATTMQWLGLFLGNLGLAIITLGFGITYWGYRNWVFMVRHLRIYGTIDIGDLTQSTTHAPREAEGFADAFDVGAL